MKGMTEVERMRQADEVVQSALEREPREQAAFLDTACAGDQYLRAEVESLLGYRERARNFIETPAYVLNAELFTEEDDSTQVEGRQIGSYRIVREIGQGGMGAVFLAERSDGEFQQKVALKIVGRGFGGSELARRFKQERQILASLNHPNIARLLDGGVSEEGEPFLVMEYVEGVRIDSYCDQQNLQTEDRLRLFLAVCQGVSYAHQHLIVHRDLKPSNILVTNEGVPKLLDFGIAKLLDAEHSDEHTQTNFRAFTPAYASPEQVRGERVTTASDVYSLGVLLQELLHGTRHTALMRMEDGGWQSENLRPKTVATNVATNQGNGSRSLKSNNQGSMNAELNNIIVMARRDEPSRRYASVAQLAEDIQRYLDGLPILAQKDSFTYRAGKFIRRNKAAVGAVALVALSLIIGLTAALWQAGVARLERDRADEQRERAERRFNDVRQLSNALLTDIAPKIERLQGATEARQALVVQSLKYLDSLAQEAEGDLVLQAELAAAYEKIGDLQGNPANPNFVDTEAAIKSYEKAQAIRLKLLARNPSDFEQRRSLAENHRVLGKIYGQANDFNTETKNLEMALQIYEKLLAENPASNELKFAVAQVNYDIGRNRSSSRGSIESFSYFGKAISVLEDLRAANPNQTDVIKLLGECRTDFSNTLSWEGKQREAEAEAARAIELLEAAVAKNPNDVNLRTGLWFAYWLTSSTYEEQNDTLSHEYALKALKIIEEVVRQDVANIRAKQFLSKSLSFLGQTLINTGRPQEALLYLEKARQVLQEIIESRTKNNGLKHDLTVVLMLLGEAKFKQEKFQDGLIDFQQAANIHLEILQNFPDDWRTKRNLAVTYESIAETHEKIGGEKSQAAREHYQKVLAILLHLEAQNALSEYDRKFLERTKKTMQKFE